MLNAARLRIVVNVDTSSNASAPTVVCMAFAVRSITNTPSPASVNWGSNLMPVVHANPPKSCDLCSAEITTEFSDCAVPRAGGRWGNLCPPCAKAQEVSYGTGLGQRYVRGFDNKFRKVEG